MFDYIRACDWGNNLDILSPYLQPIHIINLESFLQKSFEHPVVVILNTGDVTIENKIWPSWIYKIYSTNLNIAPSKKNNALPFGILSPHIEWIQTISIKKDRDHLLYLNFNTRTHRSRIIAQQLLSQKSFIYNKINTSITIENLQSAHIEYYNDLVNSKFCLCPQGNGIDTYRMWECLYLGTIPVVEKSNFTQHFVNTLPILEVESYHKINEKMLQEQYELISKKSYDLNMLNMWYWKQKWIDDIKIIANQRNIHDLET
jgi:hypothetical protein